nr:hypothetical protein [Tanacetum cinerariifolium]GFB51873.1 hypothetical protein [Tanacetum cinerariifolium]
MSSDNAQSAVTYTSMSSDSDSPSWGIPLMNAGEFSEMDPYEEVAQQGKVHPLSPAYVPNPMELDEHVPVHVLEPEHLEYHAPSDEDIQIISISTTTHRPAYDQAPLGHRAATICMRDDILEEDIPPQRRFAFTAPPPWCDIAESSAAAARAPRSQYDFVDTVETGQGLVRSPSHDARTIARAADKAEDIGYVRALQASKQRMMTSIKEVNLRVSYQA